MNVIRNQLTQNQLAFLIPPILIICIYSLLVINYFEYFPNGWDQSESVWAIRDNYLPHSPYILYFFLGKILNQLVADPAPALTLLASLSGIFGLLSFYLVNRRLLENFSDIEIDTKSGYAFSGLAVLFLATNYLFIRQSSTQEPYTIQFLFVFLSIWLQLNSSRLRNLTSGITFGLAISVHYGTLFLFPVMIYLIQSISKSRRRIFFWIVSVLLVMLIMMFVVYFLLPISPGRDQVANTLIYARGLGPGVNLQNLRDPSFIGNSTIQLFDRLFSLNTPHIRKPPPSFPTGLIWLNGIAAFLGFVMMWFKKRRFAAFWLLYCLPYLIYEIMVGQTPDFGAYLVFSLPAIASFIAFATVYLFSLIESIQPSKLLTKIGVFSILTILIFPSIYLFYMHWHDVDQDVLEHYSTLVLSEIAASSHLSSDAIMIQHTGEWNANTLPYYARRRHIARDSDLLYIFVDRGPYTPLNPDSFEVLTTEKLITIMESGVEVYAFESNPLSGIAPDSIKPNCFEWDKYVTLDLNKSKSKIAVPQLIQEKLPGSSADLFLGRVTDCN